MSPKSVAARKQAPVGAEAVKANGSGTSRTMAAAEKGEKKAEVIISLAPTLETLDGLKVTFGDLM